jgi:hypothetical protein
LENKSLDIQTLSKDLDFLRWVSDSGHMFLPAQLVFETLAPASTMEMYHLQEMYKARYGIHTLKVGYPYLIYKKEERSEIIPLCFWDISLAPIDKAGLKWMFTRYVLALPEVNPLILDHPDFDAVSKLIHPEIHQEGIDLDNFKEIVRAIDPTFIPEGPLVSVPGEMGLRQYANGLWLCNAVSLNLPSAIAPVRKNQVIAEHLIENQKQLLSGHTFGMDVLDPQQAAAFHFTREHTRSVIVGNSGTGKKHLLKYMITNALSNGRSCLIISENMGFLSNLNATLTKDQLEDLILFQPENGDYSQFLNRLNFIIRQEKTPPIFAGDQFKDILGSCQRLLLKLSGAYHASRRKIFGDLDWVEVVSLFLQSARGIDKHPLTFRLPSDLFAFHPEEFASLVSEIAPLQKDFAAIQTLQHPLNILDTRLFDSRNGEEIAHYVNLQLTEGRDHFRLILSEYAGVLAQYQDSLNISLFSEIREILEYIEEVEGKFAEYFDLFGNDFLHTKNLSLYLYSKLSQRGRKILLAREKMVSLLNQLQVACSEQHFWNFPTPPESVSHVHLPKWMDYIQGLKESALEWQRRLPDFIHEEVLRAAGHQVNPLSPFRDKFIYLERFMDEAIENFNAKSLFLEKMEHQLLTLIKRQKWLEQQVNRLDLIILNLRDFPMFFQWKLSWKGLSPEAKAMVQALSTINPSDWVMTFKTWYYHQVLLKNFNHHLPDSTLPIETFEADWELLQSMLPRQIQALWFQKRKNRIKHLRKEGKSTLQKIMAWLEKEDLSGYDYLFFLRDILPLIPECFPVLCLSVRQVYELFGDNPTVQFDHVFWGDCQNSSLADVAKCQALGKNITFFYHPAVDKKGYGEDWIKNFPCFKLSKIHAFYQGNPWQQWRGGQISVNAVKDASVHFHRIHGTCLSNGVNESEATLLIQELSKIRFSTPDHIPRVGIICLTETQRNFILTLIFKISNEESPLKNHFSNLLHHGLKVMLPVETESEHFHLVFLLTTFDKVSYLLDPLFPNCLVEQIASLPLDNITVITSLDRAELIALDGTVSEDVFIPYIKFLEAIFDRDEQALSYEYQKFRPKQGEGFSENYSVFWSELMQRFESGNPSFELRRNIFFHRDYIPFFIKKQSPQSGYIFFCIDGFHARTEHTDFIWEMRETRKFRKYDITLLPIWSVNWWKNQELEYKRMLSIIKEQG